jgi:hypothetical protein
LNILVLVVVEVTNKQRMAIMNKINISTKLFELGMEKLECWGDVDIVAGITKLGEQVAENTKLE